MYFVLAGVWVSGLLFPNIHAAESVQQIPKNNLEQKPNFEPQHLKLVWKIKEGSKDSRPLEKGTESKTWLNACSNLGKSLLIGQGPWGMGVFASFSCWTDDKKISGNPKGKPWTLEYMETDERVSLTLMDADSRVMSEAAFGPSPYTAYFFGDKEFVDLLALKLLDGLPFLGYIAKGALIGEGAFVGRYPRSLPNGRKRPVVPPPKSLTVYRLSVDKNSSLYHAQVVGSVSQASLDPESPLEAQVQKKSEKAKEPMVHWRANEELIQSNKDSFVWFHNEAGRNRMAPDLQLAIDQIQKVLAEAADEGMLTNMLRGLKKSIIATTASGYVGVRYGPQVLPGDDLLGKTSFFGLLAEVRGGPLEGVRFYYDKLPLKAVEQDGFETSIEWSRLVVGKSFGLKLNRFADRVEITPKLGLWNFHTKLPVNYDADGKVTKVGVFDLDRAMSFSLEMGVEWNSPVYVIRPWYSFDGAGLISKINSKRVTSNRFGLDTYWTAGPKFRILGNQFKTAWLGFFIYETIGLTNNDSDVALGEGESIITDLSFTTGYAGLGVAVSW